MAIQDKIPKSRLTLRYKTEVDGVLEDITLPLRLLILGDFSLGRSEDRVTRVTDQTGEIREIPVDFDDRRVRNLDGKNIDAQLDKMAFDLEFSVRNMVDANSDGELDVKIPIRRMNSFSPEEVADQIPQVKKLLMVRRLLEEVLSTIDNRKEFRKKLGELMGSSEAKTKLLAQLEKFESLKIPFQPDPAQEAPAPETPAPEAPPEQPGA